MYDYRKMANRILVILFILLFSSLSFADDKVTTIEQEQVVVENLVKDISQYLAASKHCFVVDEECKAIYNEHVGNISKKIEEAGFPYEKYYIVMDS